MLGPQHWLAALAMLFVLFAPYQTLVQTVIIDDEIRLGVEVDSYDMIWVNVAYLVGCIYGVFRARSCRFGSASGIHWSWAAWCFASAMCSAALR